MRTLLLVLALLVAAVLPAPASNAALDHTHGTIADGDAILFEKADASANYYLTGADLKAYTAYTLPTASTTVTGGVKVDGSTITISGGVISAPYTYTLPTASASVLGGVKVDGSTITISGGVISAPYTYTLPTASASVLGGVKVDGSTITISGGVISANFTLTAATTSSLGGVIPDGTTITVDGSGDIAVGTVPWTSLSGKPAFPSGTIVGTSDTQTLTNKSIASSEITGLPSFPSGTIVGTSDTQTLTNKTLTAPTLTSPALGTPASGNLANCIFPTLNQNTTGTAANVTGTVAVGNGGTGATSFTAYAPVLAGTTSTGALQSASTGLSTAGTVLTSNGSSSVPTWQALTSASVVPASGTVSAAVNTTYMVGSATGTFTLPSASAGNWVAFVDAYGTNTYVSGVGLATNPITITTGGPNSLMLPGASGGTSSYIAGINYEVVECYYDGSRWYLQQQHPPTRVTGTLVSGTASVTIPTLVAPWVMDTSSTPNAISVTVSGTTATIHGTGTDTYALFY